MTVYLHNPLQDGVRKHFQFRNIEAERMAKYREEMFLIGIRIQHTIRSWEIVPPFNIKSVLITGEETKF